MHRETQISLSGSHFVREFVAFSFHLLFLQAPGLAGQVLADIAVGMLTQHSIVSLPRTCMEERGWGTGPARRREVGVQEHYCTCQCGSLTFDPATTLLLQRVAASTQLPVSSQLEAVERRALRCQEQPEPLTLVHRQGSRRSQGSASLQQLQPARLTHPQHQHLHRPAGTAGQALERSGESSTSVCSPVQSSHS